jgi:hypothetical protein
MNSSLIRSTAGVILGGAGGWLVHYWLRCRGGT